MQVGELVAFLTYLVQILMSVMMATFVVMMIPRAAVCADRIIEVLDTDTSVVPAARPVTEVAERGLLELRHVSFHYPGAEEPVLSDISLVARAGQTTAIIGSTGSGKTTLLNLLPRLFDATSGSVLVDGVDVRELAPEVLWRRIGLVPQKPYLFSGTVASNLRFGKPAATDDELWEALEIAQAADFVRAMPGGLDAPIDQGGTNVSGGQRQRLAIARALVRKPEIYLFDDSFSALDLATDARLRAALVPHTADAAVLIVGQRVSTISRRRPDPRARGRRRRRAGHARRAARDLPHLRRDRRVADHRRGGRMSDDARGPASNSPALAPSSRPVRRAAWRSPACRSSDPRTSASRQSDCSAGCGPSALGADRRRHRWRSPA